MTINVNLTVVDGAYFFTSDDPQAKGLCAASTDLETAFHDVSVQLNNIFKFDHGIKNPDFQPAIPFMQWASELLQAVKAELAKRGMPTGVEHGVPLHPAVIAWKASQPAYAHGAECRLRLSRPETLLRRV